MNHPLAHRASAAAALLAASLVGLPGARAAVPTLPGAAATVDAKGVARDLYSAAEKLYAGGDYEGALAVYRLAYEARPDPVFLFNMAQCFRLGGKHALALSYYREFLRLRPDAPNRADVEAFIAEIESYALASGTTLSLPPRAAAPAPSPTVAVAGPRPPAAAAGASAAVAPAASGAALAGAAPLPRGRSHLASGVGIGLTLAGGALLGVSVWSASRMSAAGADLEASRLETADDFVAASESLDRARDFARLTAGLLAAGSVALAAGATLVLVRLAGSGGARFSASAGAVLAPGGGALVVGGTFGGGAP